MPADPRLAALPAIRKLAEEEARDIWTRHVRLFREHLPLMEVVADPHDASDGFAVTVAAQAERLSDLSRPASRDAVARLVAEAVGLTCGATAPVLTRIGSQWVLTAYYVEGPVESRFCYFWEPNGLGVSCGVPGISAVTDPAEALALIALHVLGAPNAR